MLTVPQKLGWQDRQSCKLSVNESDDGVSKEDLDAVRNVFFLRLGAPVQKSCNVTILLVFAVFAIIIISGCRTTFKLIFTLSKYFMLSKWGMEMTPSLCVLCSQFERLQ